MSTRIEMDAINLKPFVDAQQAHMDDGATLYIQRLRNRGEPTDRKEIENESRKSMFDTAHMDLEFNEYLAPEGAGFEIVLYATEGATEYKKVVHHGPQTERSKDWEEIKNGE